MNVTTKLSEILFADNETMADTYIRVNEIVDFVEGYFLMNIDDVAYAGVDSVGDLTLTQLKAMLETKIDFYKKFVKTDKVGVFAKKDDLAA